MLIGLGDMGLRQDISNLVEKEEGKELSIIPSYFSFNLNTQNFAEGTEQIATGSLSLATGEIVDNGTSVTIPAGIWLFSSFITLQALGNKDSRYIEAHFYVGGVRKMDFRNFVININESNEYLSLSGSIVMEVEEETTLSLGIAGQQETRTVNTYGSSITGSQLA